MKFKNPNLSVIAYANGWTMWHYVDKDATLEELTVPGFFNPVWHLSATGDIIYLNAKDGTTQRVFNLSANKNITLEPLK